ncbi:amidohydrolase family protein [Hymenobacter cellulosivorans]|uniref:Amidohydrolase family protein n=1 Tax=Hymenobacter cellulosivorans TaxID=2932249 RepID=A0ABY4F2C5_9BACT|nr:amidohydrolase family protein [Hymenobacter cellulosivorans]UOQ50827.1 amidohydrolase family protein [Hymenobacter cellulosivorans]
MHKPVTILAFLFIVTVSRVLGQTSGIISIDNVNLIPMTQETVLSNQRVFIKDGRILKIEPTSSPRTYEVAQIIDGTGKYLIPGLSEMHYHWRSKDIESDLKLLVANGITTVRNMAEFDGQNQVDIRRKTASGELLGLNYFTSGPYLQARDLASSAQVSNVVKAHREKGYNFLKLADNLPKDLYLTLLAEAQANHVPVVGHAQRNLPLEYSLRMKSIEHVEEFVYLSDDNSNPLLKQSAADLQEVAQQIKASGVYVGTTLVVFDFINNCLDDTKFSALQKSELTKYLVREERKNFLTERNDYRKLKNREFEGVKAPVLFSSYYAWMKDFTRTMASNGVNLLTGSDTYGMVIVGFSLHKEFELLQEAGLKPYDILLASTVNPARYLNTYPLEGTITEGKNANFVLLGKNPLTDIRNTKSIAGVMLKGKWFDQKALKQMLQEVEAAYK